MNSTLELKQLNYIYKGAKSRCTNPNTRQWHNYGGRGIKFKFNSFEEFLNELGPRPTGYTLDRVNNDGHYEVGNVKWSTRQEQNRNKGIYSTNKVKVRGISIIKPTGKYITIRYTARTSCQLRKTLYKGPDFFEACCARKAWESIHG